MLYQENLLLLIKLLKNTYTEQDVSNCQAIYDSTIFGLGEINLALNLAIKVYVTKLSKTLTKEEVVSFLRELRELRELKDVKHELIYNVIASLLDLEKMIIRFNKKAINLHKINNLINQYAKSIYNDAAKLLLDLNYQQYNDLQLSIHHFKKTIKEELMYNNHLAQHPSHFIAMASNNMDSTNLNCECSIKPLLVLFKKVFISSANNETDSISSSVGSTNSSSTSLITIRDSNLVDDSLSSDDLSSEDSQDYYMGVNFRVKIR